MYVHVCTKEHGHLRGVELEAADGHLERATGHMNISSHNKLKFQDFFSMSWASILMYMIRPRLTTLRPWIHAPNKPLGKGIRELIRQRKSFAKKEMVKFSMTKSKDGTTRRVV